MICFEDFTSLNYLKIFLQNVNSKQRANYQLCTERCTITTIIKVIIASEKRVISLSVSTLIVDYIKLIIAFALKSARSFIVCYTCKHQIICSRIAFRTRSILWSFEFSHFNYMKSSFQKIERMRKYLSKRMRQKTSDFHQRHDERCVNFFNNKHVKWFFYFWIFDYWMYII